MILTRTLVFFFFATMIQIYRNLLLKPPPSMELLLSPLPLLEKMARKESSPVNGIHSLLETFLSTLEMMMCAISLPNRARLN
jgi:hypothetical protein